MAATVITAKKMLSVRAMRLPFMLLPAIPDSIKMMTPVVVSTTGKIRDLFTLLFRIDAARNSQTTLPYCIPIAMTAEVCRSASTIDRHKDA